MSDTKVNRLFNLVLRGMTLASKFLLIFFLARFLEPADLGVYGLIVATIGYVMFLLGFDFYAFTSREILKRDLSEWGGLLKDQASVSFVCYVIFLPLLSIVFFQGLLPWRFAGWFFALLVLEHLTQELGRLLITISEQLLASLVLFLRSGVWAVLITVLMFFEPGLRSLDLVFGAWCAGAFLGLCLGVFRLMQLNIGGWRKKIDWRWIAKGLKVAIPLLVASLALRGVFTLDRYWFEVLVGLNVLGAYVLFIGIGNALLSFLDAGVFAFAYPALIRAHNRQEVASFRQSMRKLFIHTLVISFTFSVVALLLVGPLLVWIDKSLYIEHQNLFPWLLLAMVLYAVSMIPHYGLYAQGYDRQILISHIASLQIFILATWALSIAYAHLAVPFGLCISFLFMLCWKSWCFYRLTPAPYCSFQS